MSRSRQPQAKAMTGWLRKTPDGTGAFSASIGNDFTGSRGERRAVKGAKKFIRSRVRFDGKQSIRQERWRKDHD
jgi:hypothetical protein